MCNTKCNLYWGSGCDSIIASTMDKPPYCACNLQQQRNKWAAKVRACNYMKFETGQNRTKNSNTYCTAVRIDK